MAKNKNNSKSNKTTIPAALWFTFLIGSIIVFVCAVFLISRWFLNTYYVAETGKNVYHKKLEESLLLINVPDAYVPYYNLGNYYYNEGDYEKAMDYYYRAIEAGIPYGKECPVKVNLALSMIGEITQEQWDAFFARNESEEMKSAAQGVTNTLMTARGILIEDGCAHDQDEDGHNAQAQLLKDEIDELLKDDQNDDNQDQDENDDENQDDQQDQNNNDDQNNQSSQRENQIRDEIQDHKDEAQKERAEDRDQYERYYGDELGLNEGGGEGGEGSGGDDDTKFW